MRFGSVEFFKVLIKTVLAIFFFVPLAGAIVLAIFLANTNAKLDETKQENDRLSVVADVLAEEKTGTPEDFCDILERSGISYEELVSYINKEKKLSAEDFYKILSDGGMSDEDIIIAAASKNTVNAEKLYNICSESGISAMDLVSVAIEKGGITADSCYKILSECGMSDSEIVAFIDQKHGSSQSSSKVEETPQTSEPQTETNPYADLYTDMYVTAPAEYVREQGKIYFTFDDGPSDYTYSILTYLREFNIKATFFVVPERTDKCYELLRAIASEGHSIGVHSSSHEYEKIYDSVEAYLEDFHEAWDIIKDATGITTEIFRFPGGSKNDYNEKTRDAIIEEMTRRGFRFYDWNVDSGDAAGATWTDMYNSIQADVSGNYRSFILMHDSASTPNTPLVLEDILKALVNSGYTFDKINNDTKPVQFIGPFS